MSDRQVVGGIADESPIPEVEFHCADEKCNDVEDNALSVKIEIKPKCEKPRSGFSLLQMARVCSSKNSVQPEISRQTSGGVEIIL